MNLFGLHSTFQFSFVQLVCSTNTRATWGRRWTHCPGPWLGEGISHKVGVDHMHAARALLNVRSAATTIQRRHTARYAPGCMQHSSNQAATNNRQQHGVATGYHPRSSLPGVDQASNPCPVLRARLLTLHMPLPLSPPLLPDLCPATASFPFPALTPTSALIKGPPASSGRFEARAAAPCGSCLSRACRCPRSGS